MQKGRREEGMKRYKMRDERERERVTGAKEGQRWLGRTRVRRRTDGTIRERKGREEEIHWKGLVVRGDNMRFLTGRKSELRDATPRRSFSTCEILVSCISFVDLAISCPSIIIRGCARSS